MHQMMTPHPHLVNQMQVCYPQYVYTRQVAQPQQGYQVFSANVLPSKHPHLNSMQRPRYLPKVAVVSTLAGNFPSTNGNVAMKRISERGSVTPDRFFKKPGGDPYSCHFLGQLEGHYQTDAPGNECIEIKLACNDSVKYAIVDRESYGEKVPNLHIYDEATRFMLCSVTGDVRAVMPKGLTMKHRIKWFTKNGSVIIWNRRGNVLFQLTSIKTISARNDFTNSEYTGSQMSSGSLGQSGEVPPDPSMNIRQETSQSNDERKQGLTNLNSTRVSFISENKRRSAGHRVTEKLSDGALFELFKAQSRKDPSLAGKFLEWGFCVTPDSVTEAEVLEVTKGRIWLSLNLILPTAEDTERFSAILGELQGAYQEVLPDVYMQPLSTWNEGKVQRRLRKGSNGLFTIEENFFKDNIWLPCVKEHPYGNWIDVMNNGAMYKAQVVPMISIFNKIKNEWPNLKDAIRWLDLLFKSHYLDESYNKIKLQNIEQNIGNLCTDLRKEKHLRFATLVASIANSIANGVD